MLSIYAQSENTTNLTVNISEIDATTGKVYVAVFTSDNWLNKRIAGGEALVKDGIATVEIANIPYGTYGVSAYFDENDNKELDKGLFGIPKEPVACSNGAKGFMGPPKFKDAKFELKDSSETILLKF